MLLIFPYVQSRLVFFFKIVLVVPNPPFCISTKKISIASVLSKWQEARSLFSTKVIVCLPYNNPKHFKLPHKKKEVISRPPVSLQLNTVCGKLRKGKENSGERNVRAIIIFAGCNCWKNHEKKANTRTYKKKKKLFGKMFSGVLFVCFSWWEEEEEENQ